MVAAVFLVALGVVVAWADRQWFGGDPGLVDVLTLMLVLALVVDGGDDDAK